MQKIKCFDYCGDKNAFIPLLGFALSDISETLDEEAILRSISYRSSRITSG